MNIHTDKAVIANVFRGLFYSLLLLLVTPSVNAENYHHMGRYGMGHMGPGHMGMGYMGMLDLSNKQRKAMREINRNNRAKRWALRDQMADYSDQLYALYDQDKPDPGKIGAVYKKIFDIRRQLIEERIRQRNQQYDVLTKEQREQMKSWHSRMDDDDERGMGMMHRMMR
ncbi:MAG: Spy/CpxP family protein refolding chaperone [Gammaproteobacteria bacterium]